MGIESQVLSFIVEVHKRNFDKNIRSIEKRLEEFEENAKTVFDKGLLAAGKAGVKALDSIRTVLEHTLPQWVEHADTMNLYRKEAGLTREEIQEFSNEVILSSSRYGVALSRVAHMARFVGKGLDEGREKAVRLSSAMADLSDWTGATDDSINDLTFTLYRQFNVQASKTQNMLYGLTFAARDANVPLEDIVRTLGGSAEALRSLPIEQAIRDFGALAIGMTKAGATGSQVQEIMSQLGDTKSPLRQLFRSSGKDILQFTENLRYQVQNLRDQLKLGRIDTDQYDVSVSQLASNYNISSFSIEKFADSYDHLGGTIKAFDEVMNKSTEENRKRLEGEGSALTKFSKRLETWKSGFYKTFEDLWGPKSAIWGWLEDVMDGMEDFATEIDKTSKTAKKFGIGFEAAEGWLGVLGLRKRRELNVEEMMKGFPEISPRKNVEGRADYSRMSTEDRVHLFMNQMKAKEIVQPSAAPSPDQVSRNDTETLQATKDMASSMRRIEENQRQALRQSKLESLSSTGSGNSRGGAARAVGVILK